MPALQDHASEPRPRRILGIRAVALFEISFLLGAALAADTLLLDGNRFANLSPHPFWAIVLLAAAQYGTREGLVAALLCTVALLAGRLPEQEFGEDLYAWLLRVSTIPVPWFIAGVVFGEIRDGHRRKAEALAESLAELRDQSLAITKAYEQLSATKDELEARVAGQVRTVRSLYAAARAIERQGTAEVLTGVASLVRSVLSPAKFSLFMLDAGMLEAAATEGWSADDRYANAFDASSRLFQAVVGERHILTAVSPEHEAILGGEGLLAGPLVSNASAKVVGMLKIEAIPFAEFNPTTVQNFRILCDWIGTAYDNALRYEQALMPLAANDS
jgi:hypothetical protein